MIVTTSIFNFKISSESVCTTESYELTSLTHLTMFPETNFEMVPFYIRMVAINLPGIIEASRANCPFCTNFNY